ncbi:phage protein [Desulfocucumis palustris]|uniref:Phage protein n=1 Tax=Desulfocucumis palustris TaxID=1898651 RepID=A0A2L2XK16_9FIRM|nr:protein-export chaperone SecB [Desulfocucumis palustris]GBF34626.1 phage protein [Desulfocucumis palustris]
MSKDIDTYNQFIKNVELDEVVLSELEAKRFSPPEDGKWSVDLTPNFFLIEKNINKLEAAAAFDLVAKDLKDNNENEMFTLRAKFILNYNVANMVEISDEVIDRFIKTNVPINSWPYARELISSVSIRLGYPALIIGMFKVAR